jgi:hypothetical protein
MVLMRVVTDLENGPYDPMIWTLVTGSLFVAFSPFPHWFILFVFHGMHIVICLFYALESEIPWYTT